MSSYAPMRPTRPCHACHAAIDSEAVVCMGCGVMQPSASAFDDKKLLPATLLCGLLGPFGAHRFYVGKVGTGILQLVTLGGLGVWWMVDFVMLVTGNFRDKEGHKITEWT